MKSAIVIVLAVFIVNAGRTSAWSPIINLRETATRGNAASHPVNDLSMTVMTDPHNGTVIFHIGGIPSSPAPLLRIYGINGRMLEDLSGSVHSGSAPVIWRKPALSGGLFFATLQSRIGARTVRFIMYE